MSSPVKPTAEESSPDNPTAPSSSSANSTSQQTPAFRYQRKSGVDNNAGGDYEWKMLTLFFQRMLAADFEFKLASNMEAAGAFDDLVMRYRKQFNAPWITYCVQLKHKQGKSKVIPKIEFLKVAGDFSLVKYCVSYASVIDPVTKELQSSDKPLLILYTNANIPSDLVDEIQSDDLLSTGGKVVSFKPGGEVYQELCELVDFKKALVLLNMDITGLSEEELKIGTKVANSIQVALGSVEYKNKAVTSWKNELLETPSIVKLNELLKKLELVSDEKMYSSFLAEFQVYTGQACERELDAKIKEELVKVWKSSNDLEAKDMFNELLNGVQKWWKQGNTFLTLDSPLWYDVIKSQAGFLSKETINGLTKTGVKFDDRSLQKLYKKIKKSGEIFHLCVDSRTEASSLRVHHSLAKFGAQDSNVLHVNIKSLLAREDHVLSAWATRWCPVLVVECDDELDRKQASRICEEILKVLGKQHETKRVILISRREHELNERLYRSESYKYINDNGNWHDLTEETKTNILRVPVFMNRALTEDAPTLSVLVGKDKGFFNKVNQEVISQFISGDFSVGKDLDKQGKYFVTRQLKASADALPFIVNSARDISGEVVLVVAEPGMGKSTLFSHLAQSAKTEDPSAWIIDFKLNDCVQYLKGVDVEHFNEHEAKILMEQVALNSGNSLEKLLFDSLKNKLVVFVDGVDEVCPRYETQVFTLLSTLRDMAFSKLFVASRPVFRKNLEKTLKVETHRLVAFSMDNQVTFFNKIRKLQNQSATDEECNNWTQNLLAWLIESLGKDNPILGVPLMNAMIAETFQERVFLQAGKEGEFKSSERLDVMSLYRQFVEKKFDLYCVEKKKTLNRDQAVERDVEKKLKEQMYHNHRLAALRVLFSSEEISTLKFIGKEKFDEDVATFLKEVSDGTEKIGIIDNVFEGVPHFVHRSFAEYFAASWLKNCFKENTKILERVHVNSAYGLIASMFHWSLAGDHPLHEAVLRRDVVAIKGFLTGQVPSNFNEEDAGGRTPLHLAVILTGTDHHPDCITILKLLLLDSKVRLNVPDKVLGWIPLQYAEMSRAWTTLQIILDSGRHNIKNMNRGPTPDPRVMLDAARDAPLSVVRYLVEMRGGNLDCRGPEGETMLHRAAEREAVEVLEYLSTHKLPINIRDRQENTALHYASQHCVRFLLKNGNLLEAVNNKGLTALQLSAQNGDYDKMVALLDANASYKPRSSKATIEQLNTSLLCAAFAGSVESVKMLVENGALADCENKNGRSAPAIAMDRGHTEVALMLLLLQNEPIHGACRRGELEIISYLLSQGVGIDCSGWRKKTPLITAAENEQLAVAALLLNKGANVKCRDIWGDTALHFSVQTGNMRVTDLLLRHGADINAKNNEDKAMLHLAAVGNKPAMVQFFLENGANVEFRDTWGNTALHIASRWGSEQVAALLLQHSADINAVNHEGEAMIHRAAWGNNLAVATLLLENGVDVDARDIFGNTALHVASTLGTEQVIALLLRYGADINAVNIAGHSMLYRATSANKENIVKLLLENGVNLDCRDLNGNTALHIAYIFETYKIADLLQQHGADVNALNNEGLTPGKMEVRKG